MTFIKEYKNILDLNSSIRSIIIKQAESLEDMTQYILNIRASLLEDATQHATQYDPILYNIICQALEMTSYCIEAYNQLRDLIPMPDINTMVEIEDIIDKKEE